MTVYATPDINNITPAKPIAGVIVGLIGREFVESASAHNLRQMQFLNGNVAGLTCRPRWYRFIGGSRGRSLDNRASSHSDGRAGSGR
jgi:hypothetical protein